MATVADRSGANPRLGEILKPDSSASMYASRIDKTATPAMYHA